MHRQTGHSCAGGGSNGRASGAWEEVEGHYRLFSGCRYAEEFTARPTPRDPAASLDPLIQTKGESAVAKRSPPRRFVDPSESPVTHWIISANSVNECPPEYRCSPSAEGFREKIVFQLLSTDHF